MAFVARMKARWGVGVWGVIAILTAFSLAGMTVVRLRKLVLGFVLPPDAPAWVWWVSYAAIIFPLYQVVPALIRHAPRAVWFLLEEGESDGAVPLRMDAAGFLRGPRCHDR